MVVVRARRTRIVAVTDFVISCLDDVAAVVIDIGTHTTKAGYAGEDTPRCVIPTVRPAVLFSINLFAIVHNMYLCCFER